MMINLRMGHIVLGDSELVRFAQFFDWTRETGPYLTESGNWMEWAVDNERPPSLPGWLILGVSTSLGSTDSWSLPLKAGLNRSYRK